MSKKAERLKLNRMTSNFGNKYEPESEISASQQENFTFGIMMETANPQYDLVEYKSLTSMDKQSDG